jgi:hypothetical protein
MYEILFSIFFLKLILMLEMVSLATLSKENYILHSHVNYCFHSFSLIQQE